MGAALRFEMAGPPDVAAVRRLTRDVAREAGLAPLEQTKLATVVSELARQVLTGAGAGHVSFDVAGGARRPARRLAAIRPPVSAESLERRNLKLADALALLEEQAQALQAASDQQAALARLGRLAVASRDSDALAGGSVVAGDLAQERGSFPLPAPPGARSAVVVAIPTPGGPWGVLAACDRRPDRFTAPVVGFMDAAVGLLASSIARTSLEDAARHAALHDPLTGLPNRSFALAHLAAAVSDDPGRADRAFTRPAVLFVDLDGFKGVNDTLGHTAGDQVLVETAQRLSRRLRPTDVLARLGGEVATRASTFDNPSLAARRVRDGLRRGRRSRRGRDRRPPPGGVRRAVRHRGAGGVPLGQRRPGPGRTRRGRRRAAGRRRPRHVPGQAAGRVGHRRLLPRPAGAGAARVLVVEDNPADGQLLRALLGSAGHEITEVADPAGFVAALDATRPDLVLMDLRLRGTSGFDPVKQAEASRAADPPGGPRDDGASTPATTVRSSLSRAAADADPYQGGADAPSVRVPGGAMERHTNRGQAAARCRRARWFPTAEVMCSSGCMCRGHLTAAQCRERFDALLLAVMTETS